MMQRTTNVVVIATSEAAAAAAAATVCTIYLHSRAKSRKLTGRRRAAVAVNRGAIYTAAAAADLALYRACNKPRIVTV